LKQRSASLTIGPIPGFTFACEAAAMRRIRQDTDRRAGVDRKQIVGRGY
jgi:hypothetical protein